MRFMKQDDLKKLWRNFWRNYWINFQSNSKRSPMTNFSKSPWRVFRGNSWRHYWSTPFKFLWNNLFLYFSWISERICRIIFRAILEENFCRLHWEIFKDPWKKMWKMCDASVENFPKKSLVWGYFRRYF